MKNCSSFLLLLIVLVFAPVGLVRAQSGAPSVYTRPRLANPAQMPPVQTQTPQTQTKVPQPTSTPAQRPTSQTGAPTPSTSSPMSDATTPAPEPAFTYAPLQPAQPIAFNKARARITEAQRLMRARLTPTAMTPSLSFVTIAALEHDSNQIHLVTVPKQTFLTRGMNTVVATSQGMNVRLQVVRPNYVNTAVIVADLSGRQLTPLVVEYPIEKFGSFREMAYYTSAHPALLSPELVRHGQGYVRTMLDNAAKRLRDKGKNISPDIVDIAERLCVVEHVDHDRFRREDRTTLYNEVYTLFALNELDTYRYSVSSAGAGGMVQMIPSTYQTLRRLHPAVGLNPDFVAGMRNHGNALEAMLLHMQDNWNELSLNTDVLQAMTNNWATKPELVAAGYNSNSARLPLYIRRGGTAWRTLIPRETQMYLQIYKSVESLMEFKPRS